MLLTRLTKEKLFHPHIVILISLAAALIYAIYATLRFSGDKLSNQYYYVVPIVAVFVIFLLNRAEKIQRTTSIQRVIDFATLLTAMWRVIGDIPYVSGHALFLTYCIWTIKRKVGRIPALIVMLEVLYLKFFVWNDWVSVIVGILLGTIAAIIYRRNDLSKRISG